MAKEETKPDKAFMKKIMSYSALFFSFGALVAVFLLGIIGWTTLDDAEKTINEGMDTACTGIATADSTFVSAAQSIDELQVAFSEGGASFVDLADSIRGMAGSMDVLNESAANDMADAADSIEAMGSNIENQSDSLAEMGDYVSTLRISLNSQRDVLCGNEITDMFGTIKVLFVISVLLLLGLLLIISLNAGRGII